MQGKENCADDAVIVLKKDAIIEPTELSGTISQISTSVSAAETPVSHEKPVENLHLLKQLNYSIECK
jgi:hypothetical protein